MKVAKALSDGRFGVDSFYSLHLQLAPDLVVTGAPVDIQLEMGGMDTAQLVIANQGGGYLDGTIYVMGGGFTLYQPPPTAATAPAGSVTIGPESKAVRGMSLVQAADSTFDLGPNAFGYTLKDSYTDGGPAFNWIEIAPPAGGHSRLLQARE